MTRLLAEATRSAADHDPVAFPRLFAALTTLDPQLAADIRSEVDGKR